MLKLPRILMITLAATVGVVGMQSSAMAEAATIRFQIYKAGLIVGVSGGKGVLTYNGKIPARHWRGEPRTIGASKAELIGTVFKLNDPSDIEGTYSAAEASLAVAEGGGYEADEFPRRRPASQGQTDGLYVSVDLSGMQISLKR